MAVNESSLLFDAVSEHPVIACIVVLVVCWLVLRYIATDRKRRVSDYVKKFDPVDVSIIDTLVETYCTICCIIVLLL